MIKFLLKFLLISIKNERENICSVVILTYKLVMGNKNSDNKCS